MSRGWAAKPDGDPAGPDGGPAGGGGLQPPGRGGVPGLHLGHRGRHQLAAGACCPHAARHSPPPQAAQGPPLPHLCQQVTSSNITLQCSQLADSSAAKPKRGRIKVQVAGHICDRILAGFSQKWPKRGRILKMFCFFILYLFFVSLLFR